MRISRILISLVLLLGAVYLQGCGTANYEERFEQRGNELKSNTDQYDQ